MKTKDKIKYNDYNNKQVKAEKKYKYEIIVGVQNSAKVNKSLHENIVNFAKRYEAKITYIPLKDHNQSFASQTVDFDPYLTKQGIEITKQYRINDNLIAMDAQLLPQALNPLTGIHRLGSNSTKSNPFNKSSVIVSHPKLDLELVETGFDSHPRLICTTGVITNPKYLPHMRTGVLAKANHKLGFVFIKKHANNIFNLVQIEADSNGSFYHNGYHYIHGKKPVKSDCHVVLGDNHGHEMDKNIIKLLPNILKQLKPSNIFLHDSFNGTTVNGHEMKMTLSRYNTYKTYSLSLEYELKQTIELEKRLFSGYNITKVHSNHDVDWLDRRLEEGEYTKDPINTLIMHKLAIMKMENYKSNSLENAYTIIDKNHNLNITFSNRSKPLKSFGNFVHHGDIGKGGSKGNIKTFDATLGGSISGHTHKPARFGNAIDVGHTTYGNQGYKKGLNGWAKAMAIVYPNGSVELVLFVEDKNGKLYTI